MLLTQDWEWKSLDIDDGKQWEDYYDYMSSGANVSDTCYTQSNDVLEPILSAPQYNPPSVTFTYDMSFNKGYTDNK